MIHFAGACTRNVVAATCDIDCDIDRSRAKKLLFIEHSANVEACGGYGTLVALHAVMAVLCKHAVKLHRAERSVHISREVKPFGRTLSCTIHANVSTLLDYAVGLWRQSGEIARNRGYFVGIGFHIEMGKVELSEFLVGDVLQLATHR